MQQAGVQEQPQLNLRDFFLFKFTDPLTCILHLYFDASWKGGFAYII